MLTKATAASLSSPGFIERIEKEIPPPAHNEAALQVGFVGICGSDVEVYYENSRVCILYPYIGRIEFANIFYLPEE